MYIYLFIYLFIYFFRWVLTQRGLGLQYGLRTTVLSCVVFVLQLYIDTIRETLEEEDKSRPFLSSSPSNGVDTEKEGWVAKKPSSPYWGDGKRWNR